MNKIQLAEKLVEKVGLKKKHAILALETLIETMTETLAKGEKVQLIPFGIFNIKQRKAREGRNPRTGEKVHIKARKAVSFRVGKSLKKALNH